MTDIFSLEKPKLKLPDKRNQSHSKPFSSRPIGMVLISILALNWILGLVMVFMFWLNLFLGIGDENGMTLIVFGSLK